MKAILEIEMPKSCGECDIVDLDNGIHYCNVIGEQIKNNIYTKRHPNCPLKPINDSEAMGALKEYQLFKQFINDRFIDYHIKCQSNETMADNEIRNLNRSIDKFEQALQELAEKTVKIFKYFSYHNRIEKYQGLTESSWKEYKELINYFETLCEVKENE